MLSLLDVDNLLFDGYYSWGLNQIAKAVSFSINDCKLHFPTIFGHCSLTGLKSETLHLGPLIPWALP
ncbi:hypothetical protein OIU79_030160 [Salix purpurea]|uniref:Uncharacterized protein n=1 Tax=Salix purpurea TaxID=77065 RepID=A0A9Q0VJ30_SALPP|nr:hypothetical protein OIU79_030160 [Salix purpurea]